MLDDDRGDLDVVILRTAPAADTSFTSSVTSGAILRSSAQKSTVVL
jgi:hypothetical protein